LAIVREFALSIFESRIFGYRPIAIVINNNDVRAADDKKARQYFFLTINLLSFSSNNNVITGIANNTGIALKSSAECGK
jgi:hypothetical protein